MHSGGTTSDSTDQERLSNASDSDEDTVVTSNTSHREDKKEKHDTGTGSIGSPSEEVLPIPRSVGVNLNAIEVDIGPPLDFPDIFDDCSGIEPEPSGPRAQIDTGAFVTCTDRRDLLHSYKAFSKSSPCPVKLMPATVDSDTVPRGYGYLRVPALNEHGYLDVRAFFTPDLRTTVIDERDFIRAAGYSPKNVYSECISKDYGSATFEYRAAHKVTSAKDVVVPGILRHGKSYTGVLIPPDDPATVQKLKDEDPEFAEKCHHATIMQVYAHQEQQYAVLREELKSCPVHLHSLPFHEYIHAATPVKAIRAATERLLWHQRLGHVSDSYLYNAHKHIDGVPKFKHSDPVLETCPTCVRAKQTKEPAGQNSTRTARIPYQGLSIDFSFAGTRSSDPARAQDYVGFNGETCWILVSDHASRMKHGATRISKASPIAWLRDFLQKHSPDCDGKYVFLDQGGELYANPLVRDLFHEFGYAIRPTGADSSNQNGPVERGHLTVANAIRAMLLGANLPISFWPYAFHHWLRIDNSLPSRDQDQTPLQVAQNKRDDFSSFRTFGCRVWVRPPGRRRAKFVPNSRKGIFLGFLPQTTKNILWYDPETSKVKIAKHARFDEGMNDLPQSEVPPNVVHLQRTLGGDQLPAEPTESSVPSFEIGSSPFAHTVSYKIRSSCRHPTFGLTLDTDELNNRAYVSEIRDKTSSARLHSSTRATRNKLRGAYVTKVNNRPVFTTEEAVSELHKLRELRTKDFDIEFAIEPHLTAEQVRRAAREGAIHAPVAPIGGGHIHSLCIEDIRSIAQIRNPDVDLSESALPTDFAQVAVRAITSSAISPEEQGIGSFTRRKLRQLDTWPLWQAGEFKQLDQFNELGMFGKPTPRPPGSIVLRSHWQYQIKRDGTRRARNCCDGSPKAAPALHRFVQTYSTCVEQPIQRLFFALAAQLGYLVYGGDAKDAYAHSPPPDRPTYVAIDDAYAEWYKSRFGREVDRSLVLPVQHALQGHPESGRLWDHHISAILMSPEFGFRPTTHDRAIYRTEVDGIPVYLLRQVDDFSIACPRESIAVDIYDRLGKALQLPSESSPPFKYLGLISDFNGVDVHQFQDRIILSAERYIDRVLQTHGWTTPSADEQQRTSNGKPPTPLPPDCLPLLFSAEGYKEGSPEHSALEKKFGFAFRTLLGELLYAYVTCRPDIGYSVITLSKFSTKPAAIHFELLKKVVRYLRATKSWGIHYKRSTPISSLPMAPDLQLSIDPSLPPFPAQNGGPSLTCFMDAAHGNDLRQRRSTTGFAFMMAGGCISYKCKTQTTTATSSTEAEFYAAVTAAKQALYLRSVLSDLGFPPDEPTPIYCDNQSAINMVNARIPTERSRHIAIQFFAVQDWKDRNEIVLRHIPGILNPSDDLTKPLGWILHSRHARRLMGHYPTTFVPAKQQVDLQPG